MGAFPRRHGVRHGLEAALFPGLHHPEAGLLRQHLVRGLRGSHRHRRPAATHDHGHLLQGTLCKNGTNNLFERDFVLETGDVALRHGKYDRQDFERSSAPRAANPSRAPRPSSLPTTTSSRISTRRRSTGTRSSRTSSSSASTLPRARTSSRYSTPSTRSGYA